MARILLNCGTLRNKESNRCPKVSARTIPVIEKHDTQFLNNKSNLMHVFATAHEANFSAELVCYMETTNATAF